MQSTISHDISDEKYMELLSKVKFSPIFIMGDHRSGTTLLYKILAATECFNFVKIQPRPVNLLPELQKKTIKFVKSYSHI